MAYGVVQRHGAEIESAPGAGTTMRLSFPDLTTLIAGSPQIEAKVAMPSRLRDLSEAFSHCCRQGVPR